MATDTGAPEHPGDGARWKHRRRMAYAAMAGLLVVAARSLSDSPLPATNADVLTTALWAFSAIVGSYMGFAVADDVFRARNKP